MGARRTKDENYDGSIPLEDPKQELFCELFTSNSLPKYWASGQFSYEFAYGHSDKIDAFEEKIDNLKADMAMPKGKRKKSISQMEREIEVHKAGIERVHRMARACSSRLLTTASVKKRVGYRLDHLSVNLIVDRELTYLIQQRDDNTVKMNAIEHYNKREQRIREKVEIKHAFEPIKQVKVEAPTKK